jgi:ParB-like chromosome segregation protein Spo0J
MAAFQTLVRGLRRAEQQLQRQLEGIRTAISSLEFGGAAAPPVTIRKRGRGRPAGRKNAATIGRKRTMSAKARKAISAAQKKRWALKRAEEKKK